jgi:hypothetical protein
MKVSALLKVAAVSLLAIGLVAPTAISQDDAARKIVGTWRLIKIEGTGIGSGPGEHPTGYIMYDNTGHMGVHECFECERPAMKRGPDGQPTPEEMAKAYTSYHAYFGRYSVDGKAGTITHHVEGGISPGGIGRDNVRYFELKGNRVTLFVASVKNGVLQKKADTTRRLIWERVEPKK